MSKLLVASRLRIKPEQRVARHNHNEAWAWRMVNEVEKVIQRLKKDPSDTTQS